MNGLSVIKKADPELAAFVGRELKRQRGNLELIASENFVSEAVLAAAGSVLTNKYAEGYPGRRYYGGCEFVDGAETLAVERAKKCFGAEYANVQPHCGSSANMAAYRALISPGDTVLSLSLAHGGHLTHGAPVSFSGADYKIAHYGVDRETERLDYDEIRRLALEHKVKLIVGGASAYPRIIDFKRMREIADEAGAYLTVDMAHIAGLVAAGLHPSPVPYADIVTTTTHKTLRGPRGGLILCKEKYGRAVDKAVFPHLQGGPLMHIIAAKAIALAEAMTPEFKTYSAAVVRNAGVLAEEFKKRGLRLVSGGTDNHLLLIDVARHNSTGRKISDLCDNARITLNKNTLPFETLSPQEASGIRVGTPAVTTRGMREGEMRVIADLVSRIILDGKNAVANVRKEVKALTDRFPLYT